MIPWNLLNFDCCNPGTAGQQATHQIGEAFTTSKSMKTFSLQIIFTLLYIQQGGRCLRFSPSHKNCSKSLPHFECMSRSQKQCNHQNLDKTLTRWLNGSLCVDGSNLRSQFRLHSLARDASDFLARSLNTRDYQQTPSEQDFQNSVRNQTPIISSPFYTSPIHFRTFSTINCYDDHDTEVGNELLMNCFKRLELCFEDNNDETETCRY